MISAESTHVRPTLDLVYHSLTVLEGVLFFCKLEEKKTRGSQYKITALQIIKQASLL